MAKQSLVKCPYCNEQFDRDSIEYVQVGRRYAHKECEEKHQQEQTVVQEIHKKMEHLCGSAYSKVKVNNQIKTLLKDGKSVAGILKTLDYWYDVQKNNPADAKGGIGIVAYVYGEAQNYWYKKDEYKDKNKGLNIDDYIVQGVDTYKIARPKWRKPKRVKLFNIR